MKAHQRVVWSLIFIVFGVHLVKAEVQENQAHKGIAREVHPDHQDGLQWMRKEDGCIGRSGAVNQKERKNSQGKDPRTFEENSHGRDPSTVARNSQGNDPRTLVENSKGENFSTYQINSQRKDPRTLGAPVER